MTDKQKKTRAPKAMAYESILAQVKNLPLETKLLLRSEITKMVDQQKAHLQQQIELINGKA